MVEAANLIKNTSNQLTQDITVQGYYQSSHAQEMSFFGPKQSAATS